MKLTLKNIAIAATIFSISAISGCKKDSTPTPTNTNTNSQSNPDTYSSLSDFYAKNGVPLQTFTINGATGGSFTTPQGTKVRIPANAFWDNSNQVVTGPVTIQFKDIYKKSDMLLSNVPTMLRTGQLLKSGGEFFIKALSASVAVNLAPAKSIVVQQPNSLPKDSSMMAYIADTTGWTQNSNYVVDTAGSYLYQITTLCMPLNGGSLCNTDDYNYFSHYSPTSLTLQTTDTVSLYNFQAYLMFTGINTTCVYHTYPLYNGAPLGLQCTLVVVGVRLSNSKLYSAFVPITITANLNVSYHLTQTTTANFKTQLSALNN
jgi:hypothetical protein